MCLVALGSQNGATAVHWAALNGHTESIECLVAHKAQVDIQDKVSFRVGCLFGSFRESVARLRCMFGCGEVALHNDE